MKHRNETDRCPKGAKKTWVTPKALSEKVRDVTKAAPAHHSSPDGFCAS